MNSKKVEIERLIAIIERLRKYHMDDVVPSTMRRIYLTKLMRLAPRHPKLKEFLPFDGKRYHQTSKRKVARDLIALKEKQNLSVRLLAKYDKVIQRFKKKKNVQKNNVQKNNVQKNNVKKNNVQKNNENNQYIRNLKRILLKD